jgi:hypothetical protein
MVVIILILIVGLSLIIFIPMSIRNMLIDWDNFVEFGKLCWRSKVNLENIYLVFCILFIYLFIYLYMQLNIYIEY